MRSWVAIWVLLLSCVFVAHTAAASVAPYNTCCQEECYDMMSLCVANCSTCTQPAAKAESLRSGTAAVVPWGPAQSQWALPFPAYAPWTPPG